MRTLSHSAISLYQDCPQKYKFRYIEGIKEKPKSYFSFGQSLHKALEFFYRSQLIPPTLAEVLLFYETNWVKEGYKSPEDEKLKFLDGKRIVSAFHNKHAQDWKPPMATEYDFTVKIDGVDIRGKIDRIDKLPNNSLHVIDYKTGKVFNKNRVEDDPQLTLYQMACEEAFQTPVERLTLYYLPTLNALTSARHSNEHVMNLRREIITVKSAVDEGHFDPKPEDYKCRWCDYKKLCPAWQNGLAIPQKTASAVLTANKEATSLTSKLENLIRQTENLLKDLQTLKNDLE